MSFVERIRGKLKKRAATKHQLVVSGHNEEICPLKDDITKMESEREELRLQGRSELQRRIPLGLSSSAVGLVGLISIQPSRTRDNGMFGRRQERVKW